MSQMLLRPVVLCALSLAAVAASAEGAAAADDTVGAFIHGVAFDGQGRPVEVTPALVVNTQRALIARLQQQADDAHKPQFARHIELARSGNMSEGDQVWANALTIGQLTQNDGSSLAVSARALNMRLLTRYAALIGKPIAIEDLKNNVAPRFVTPNVNVHAQLVNGSNLGAIFSLLLIEQHVKDYVARCNRAGVPVPTDMRLDPPPNAAGTTWTRVGDLDAKSSLLNPDNPKHPKLTIYSLGSPPLSNPKKPEGLCLTLPIVKDTTVPATTWNAFGIICQSVTTGLFKLNSNSHACFLDNNGDVAIYPEGKDVAITNGNWIAPPDLPGYNMCTDCHAGENAFVVHSRFPQTPMDTAKQKFNADHATNNLVTRNNWYSPFVDLDWPQNPEVKPYPTGDGTCGTCHNSSGAGRLPRPAHAATPPDEPLAGVAGGWPARDNLYKFCDFILPNELTSSTAGPPLAMGVSQLAGAMAGNNGLADVGTIFNRCTSLFPGFAGSLALWISKHIDPPNP